MYVCMYVCVYVFLYARYDRSVSHVLMVSSVIVVKVQTEVNLPAVTSLLYVLQTFCQQKCKLAHNQSPYLHCFVLRHVLSNAS